MDLYNQSKGIANIDYDNNNMPRRIQFTNGNVMEYIYSAGGEKLRTIHRTAVANITVPIGSTLPLTKANTLSVDSTDYIGNFELGSGLWYKYYFNGGYCRIFSGKTNARGRQILLPLRNLWVTFHYYTQDHLGNNRAVVNENGTLEQVTHYYPFGGVYGDAGSDPDCQDRKYNGKELDRMHGLDWYDYGARNYDAAVPMWTSVDPLCEKYYDISPYAYCVNNPVNAVDPDGRDHYSVNSEGKFSLIEKNDDEYNTIYAHNKDGSINENASINVSKGFLSSENNLTLKGRTSKDADGNKVSDYSVSFYSPKDEKESVTAFEFLSNNTDVEWSNVKISFSEGSQNFVQTSHLSGSELGQRYIFEKYKGVNGAVIDYAYHNHNAESIGYSPGDIKFAKDSENVYPKIKLAVYAGSQYTTYDQYDLPGTLGEVPCVVQKKQKK